MNIDNIKQWLEDNYKSNVGVMMACAGKEEHLAHMVKDCIKDLNLIEADQWISVETEWPDPSKHNRVLGFDGSYIFECEWNDGYWCNIGGDELTHWKPCPKYPTT